MTTFMEPATIDIPIETFEPTVATCTAGYDWCVGECTEGDPFHWSGYRWILGLAPAGRSWVREEFTIHLRVDEGDDSPKPLILISDGLVGFDAEQARQAAAELLNAADRIEPLPLGVMMTAPELIHLDDELLTDDGWQKVTGVMAFTGDDTTRIFTPERDPESNDGWELDASNLVQIRRRIHGSCAIQFVEPIPAVGGTK